MRCWGSNTYGQLGYGHTELVGYDDTPASAGPVDVGGPVRQVSVGFQHACALLESGAVRCWGHGDHLGLAQTSPIGDNEAPSKAPPVQVF